MRPRVNAMVLILGMAWGVGADAQITHLERLPADLVDASPPSARVDGSPGSMAVRPLECRNAPSSDLRRRVVDVAAQEWGFFGFPIADEIRDMRLLPPGLGPVDGRAAFLDASRSGRRYWRLPNPEEAGRVAASIAGYWAVTAEGPGIVRRQNDAWNGQLGIGSRWVDPWSAAFVSWVMCEAGLATSDRFQRSIAHRAYIDQAIRARDRGVGAEPSDGDAGVAFVAFDLGESEIEPGDMLCASSRPPYRNLAERRRQLGEGARTHCDIVVKVDAAEGRILAIGGNVMRSVSLKILAADADGEGRLRLRVSDERSPLFAHLKLRAAPIEPNALDFSPTVEVLACGTEPAASPRLWLVASAIGALPTESSEGIPPSFSTFDRSTDRAYPCSSG